MVRLDAGGDGGGDEEKGGKKAGGKKTGGKKAAGDKAGKKGDYKKSGGSGDSGRTYTSGGGPSTRDRVGAGREAGSDAGDDGGDGGGGRTNGGGGRTSGGGGGDGFEPQTGDGQEDQPIGVEQRYGEDLSGDAGQETPVPDRDVGQVDAGPDVPEAVEMRYGEDLGGDRGSGGRDPVPGGRVGPGMPTSPSGMQDPGDVATGTGVEDDPSQEPWTRRAAQDLEQRYIQQVPWIDDPSQVRIVERPATAEQAAQMEGVSEGDIILVPEETEFGGGERQLYQLGRVRANVEEQTGVEATDPNVGPEPGVFIGLGDIMTTDEGGVRLTEEAGERVGAAQAAREAGIDPRTLDLEGADGVPEGALEEIGQAQAQQQARQEQRQSARARVADRLSRRFGLDVAPGEVQNLRRTEGGGWTGEFAGIETTVQPVVRDEPAIGQSGDLPEGETIELGPLTAAGIQATAEAEVSGDLNETAAREQLADILSDRAGRDVQPGEVAINQTESGYVGQTETAEYRQALRGERRLRRQAEQGDFAAQGYVAGVETQRAFEEFGQGAERFTRDILPLDLIPGGEVAEDVAAGAVGATSRAPGYIAGFGLQTPAVVGEATGDPVEFGGRTVETGQTAAIRQAEMAAEEPGYALGAFVGPLYGPRAARAGVRGARAARGRVRGRRGGTAAGTAAEGAAAATQPSQPTVYGRPLDRAMFQVEATQPTVRGARATRRGQAVEGPTGRSGSGGRTGGGRTEAQQAQAWQSDFRAQSGQRSGSAAGEGVQRPGRAGETFDPSQVPGRTQTGRQRVPAEFEGGAGAGRSPTRAGTRASTPESIAARSQLLDPEGAQPTLRSQRFRTEVRGREGGPQTVREAAQMDFSEFASAARQAPTEARALATRTGRSVRGRFRDRPPTEPEVARTDIAPEQPQLLEAGAVDRAMGVEGPSLRSRARGRVERSGTAQRFQDFLASERGQLQLAGRQRPRQQGRQRGQQTEPTDFQPTRSEILEGSPRDLLSTDITRRAQTRRRQAQGTFEGAPDPLGSGTPQAGPTPPVTGTPGAGTGPGAGPLQLAPGVAALLEEAQRPEVTRPARRPPGTIEDTSVDPTAAPEEFTGLQLRQRDAADTGFFERSEPQGAGEFQEQGPEIVAGGPDVSVEVGTGQEAGQQTGQGVAQGPRAVGAVGQGPRQTTGQTTQQRPDPTDPIGPTGTPGPIGPPGTPTPIPPPPPPTGGPGGNGRPPRIPFLLPGLGPERGRQATRRGPPSAPDTGAAGLTFGWYSETVTDIATGGTRIPESPSQQSLRQQPAALIRGGDLPTETVREGGEDVEAVQALLGGLDESAGFEYDFGFGFDADDEEVLL